MPGKENDHSCRIPLPQPASLDDRIMPPTLGSAYLPKLKFISTFLRKIYKIETEYQVKQRMFGSFSNLRTLKMA